jgi:hypothetical protein
VVNIKVCTPPTNFIFEVSGPRETLLPELEISFSGSCVDDDSEAESHIGSAINSLLSKSRYQSQYYHHQETLIGQEQDFPSHPNTGEPNVLQLAIALSIPVTSVNQSVSLHKGGCNSRRDMAMYQACAVSHSCRNRVSF